MASQKNPNPSKLRVAVMGATGYVGSELLRFLVSHPHVEVRLLMAQKSAGERLCDVLPAYHGVLEQTIESFDIQRVKKEADVVFTALPHGASGPVVKALVEAGLVTFDLSADFRLKSPLVYETWYGKPHAPELFREAIYGLVELHRQELLTARLIAVPGCYPTAAILALAPLLRGGFAVPEGLIVDAKSGVSGAGRSASTVTQFSEISEGLRAYKTAGKHRHVAEIEQELGHLVARELHVVFTPHLVPMTRGIFATGYAAPTAAVKDAHAITEFAADMYKDSPFVKVLPPGSHPDTLWVRGSNRVYLSYGFDARAQRIITQSVIDNLVKGAAGQAIQCLNVRYGFNESAGLPVVAAFP